MVIIWVISISDMENSGTRASRMLRSGKKDMKIKNTDCPAKALMCISPDAMMKSLILTNHFFIHSPVRPHATIKRIYKRKAVITLLFP